MATRKTTQKKKAGKTTRRAPQKVANTAKKVAVKKKSMKRPAKKTLLKRPKKVAVKRTKNVRTTTSSAKRPMKRKKRVQSKKTVQKRRVGAKKIARRKAVKPKSAKRVKRAVKSMARGASSGRRKKADDTVLLEMLLGSSIRARVLRLLFREPTVMHTQKEIAETCGVPLSKVRRETSDLASMGVLDMKSLGGKKKAKVATTFPFTPELQRLVTASFPIGRETLIKMVKPAGRVKLIIVAGVFMNDPKARVDLIVVADKYSEKRLARAMKRVEQVVAADVRWAGMETKEFLYRWKMFDRFVRDMVGGPHERLIGKVKF